MPRPRRNGVRYAYALNPSPRPEISDTYFNPCSGDSHRPPEMLTNGRWIAAHCLRCGLRLEDWRER